MSTTCPSQLQMSKTLKKPPKTLTASRDNWCSWMHETLKKPPKPSLAHLLSSQSPVHRTQNLNNTQNPYKPPKPSLLHEMTDGYEYKKHAWTHGRESSVLSKCGLTTPPDWRPFKIPVSPKITSRTSAGYLSSPSVNRKAKHTCSDLWPIYRKTSRFWKCKKLTLQLWRRCRFAEQRHLENLPGPRLSCITLPLCWGSSVHQEYKCEYRQKLTKWRHKMQSHCPLTQHDFWLGVCCFAYKYLPYSVSSSVHSWR